MRVPPLGEWAGYQLVSEGGLAVPGLRSGSEVGPSYRGGSGFTLTRRQQERLSETRKRLSSPVRASRLDRPAYRRPFHFHGSG
jgi:hypothetical protein